MCSRVSTLTIGLHITPSNVELAARGPGCPARGDVILAEDAKTGDIVDHLGMCLSDNFDVKHSTLASLLTD
jgi:hypothetical protein